MFMGAQRLDSFTTEMIFDSQAVCNLDQSNVKLLSSLVYHKNTYLEKNNISLSNLYRKIFYIISVRKRVNRVSVFNCNWRAMYFSIITWQKTLVRTING